MSAQAIPSPASPALGEGKERGIALGGGGEWFIGWLIAYCETARRLGVDLATADVSVGTSAGSIVGSYLTSHNVTGAYQQFQELAQHPEVLEEMLATTTGLASKQRATDALASATSSDVDSVREIGRASMAAKNAPGTEYAATVGQILGSTAWPSAAHHVTTVDCYTAERIVIDHNSDVPINVACAASTSVPGINGPIWVGDRYCMDGGVSASSTHSDLLAGAKRAAVFSMFSKAPQDGSFGFAMRVNPDSISEEVRYLESKGTKVMLICADPPTGTDFMDPKELGVALEMGAARAEADIAALKEFWND